MKENRESIIEKINGDRLGEVGDMSSLKLKEGLRPEMQMRGKLTKIKGSKIGQKNQEQIRE